MSDGDDAKWTEDALILHPCISVTANAKWAFWPVSEVLLVAIGHGLMKNDPDDGWRGTNQAMIAFDPKDDPDSMKRRKPGQEKERTMAVRCS